MTKTQRANNLKLAKYLMKLKPTKKRQFDMGQFSDSCGDTTTKCGSIGCAIGHGPYAGIPKRRSEDWYEYGVRQLNASDMWGSCFSDDWEVVPRQNTPKATARRIMKFLKENP